MNEKNKNIISYILSILIVGSITTCFIVAPYNSLLGLLWIFLSAIGLALLTFIVKLVKDILYEFFSSNLFQSIYRKYVTKCYESKEILEFGMRLPNHWNAWKIFVQMRCKDLEQEAQEHTQVHKGTDRKPPGDDRGGRRKGFCHSFLCRQIFSHW